MPFKDDEFDFVFETSLCHVAEKRVPRAIRELNRVVKTGLVFGSVTSDMPAGAYRWLRPVARREEARHLVGMVGVVFQQWVRPFDPSRDCTDALWAATLAANKGPGQWHADADSLRYSFFDKVDPRIRG